MSNIRRKSIRYRHFTTIVDCSILDKIRTNYNNQLNIVTYP